MDWFRLYHNIIDDPKILRLTVENRWYFVGFLSLSSREKVRGSLPPVEDIAISLRVKISKARSLVELFKSAGLIDEDVATKRLMMHGWEARQRKSDDVATRVKRFRDRSRNDTASIQTAACNDTNLLPHACATDTETDREKEIPPYPPARGGERAGEVVEPFQAEPAEPAAKVDPQAQRLMDQCGRRWGGQGVDVAADLLATFDPAVVAYAATATYDSPKFDRKLTPGAAAYWRRVCQNHRDGPPADGPARASPKPAAPIEYVTCPNPETLRPPNLRGNAHA